jgi:hypothetical protein
VASEVYPRLLPSRAVSKRNVIVGDVVEEVDFVLLQHQTCGNGVHWRISPALVEETAILVQRLEVVNVRLGSEPVQVTDLKVGPLGSCQQSVSSR